MLVPIIDLAARRRQRVGQLASACADWGFFQVANHGIEPGLVAAMQAASHAFFSQPPAARQAVSRTMTNPFGYYDRELTKNLRDRKEIFDFAPEEDTPWPRSLPGFRPALEAFACACHRLSLQLLEMCCEGLGAERSALTGHFQRGHGSFLRLNHYPVDDPLAGSSAPAPGPFGISHHTDSGAITVLLQDDVSGLQVFRDNHWYDVTPLADTLTINIGDMLQVWSNDRYRAPLHRVRASTSAARYSAAYFCNPDYRTVVAPLPETVNAGAPARYHPVDWREFRRLRAQGDFGDYGEEIQIARFRR